MEACELTSFDSNALPLDTSGRCHDNSLGVQNDRIQNLIDSNPNYNSPSDIPFAYIPRDHRYRQNTTDDERDAVFGSVQFQPNDRLDIMFDFNFCVLKSAPANHPCGPSQSLWAAQALV